MFPSPWASVHAGGSKMAGSAPLPLHDLVTRLRRSTVHVRTRGAGGGSGVIWEPSGLVITNAHVVRGPEAQVETSDGQTFSAAVISTDRERDLAALRIDAAALPSAAIGNSDALRVGELVVAVGNPLGLSGAVSTGIVHTIDAQRRFVQADVRLAPGNSGGPLATARGEVIGINSMVSGGLGLAVPSNAVVAFLAMSGPRPQLGLTARPVAFRGGLGLLVLEVAPHTPAARAGLALGDVLISIAGVPVQSARDLSAGLRAAQWSTGVEVQVLRAGSPLTLTLTVDAVPEAA